MIIDIPSKDDFEGSGIAFLNLGWEPVIKLASNLYNSEVEDWGDETVGNEYWLAAQKPLATALALVQQGIEFLLKARIAEVSPFLLIGGNPDTWPRGCHKENIRFSDFRTIDAQDLIRAHDTVVQTRLPDSFIEQYEKLRMRRNTIFHTVDKEMRVAPKEVIIGILEASHSLIQPAKWIALRGEFLYESPEAVAFDPDSVDTQIADEIHTAIEILQPVETKRFFEFNKKQRRYICPRCAYTCEDVAFLPPLAQLTPNDPHSTNVYCIICETNSPVKRVNCIEDDCKSNVIGEENNTCLVCYTDQD